MDKLRHSQRSWYAAPKRGADQRVFRSCRPQFRKTITSQISQLRNSESGAKKFPKLNISKAIFTKFVHNDDHSKNTAAGYSRNDGGKHYFK